MAEDGYFFTFRDNLIVWNGPGYYRSHPQPDNTDPIWRWVESGPDIRDSDKIVHFDDLRRHPLKKYGSSTVSGAGVSSSAVSGTPYEWSYEAGPSDPIYVYAAWPSRSFDATDYLNRQHAHGLELVSHCLVVDQPEPVHVMIFRRMDTTSPEMRRRLSDAIGHRNALARDKRLIEMALDEMTKEKNGLAASLAQSNDLVENLRQDNDTLKVELGRAIHDRDRAGEDADKARADRLAQANRADQLAKELNQAAALRAVLRNVQRERGNVLTERDSLRRELSRERDSAAALSLVDIDTRNQLDAMTKDRDSWKREHDMVKNAWSRELGTLAPKTYMHMLDALVLATRNCVAQSKMVPSMAGLLERWLNRTLPVIQPSGSYDALASETERFLHDRGLLLGDTAQQSQTQGQKETGDESTN